MKGHPRCGEPTNFKEKFLAGEKIHTIRNGDYWKLIVDKVNNGSAVLSVREWSGKAYRSKQVEIAKLTKLGWQSFTLYDQANAFIDGEKITLGKVDQVAENDGLRLLDFINWFKIPFSGGIVQFTDFRY